MVIEIKNPLDKLNSKLYMVKERLSDKVNMTILIRMEHEEIKGWEIRKRG